MLSNISHIGSLKFKLKMYFFISLATLQVLKSHTGLVTTLLYRIDHFRYYKKIILDSSTLNRR